MAWPKAIQKAANHIVTTRWNSARISRKKTSRDKQWAVHRMSDVWDIPVLHAKSYVSSIYIGEPLYRRVCKKCQEQTIVDKMVICS